MAGNQQALRSEWVRKGDTLELRLQYLRWQRELRRKILVEGKKRIALACAARCGKDAGSNRLITELPMRLALDRMKDPECRLIPRVNTWVVAPTKKLYLQNWNEMEAFLPTQLIVRSSKQDGEVLLRGDIRYAFKSADRPETLVAEGLDFLLFTECSRVKTGMAWEESLQPRLISPGRLGLAILNGSPRNGKSHWFRKFWQLCKDKENEPGSKYAQFNLSSYDNEANDPAELDDLQDGMPERLYRTEILGIWPDEDEKPFRDSDVEQLFVKGDGRIPAGPYIIAIDVARSKDMTFITVWSVSDAQPQVIFAKTLHREKLHKQMEKILGVWKQYPGQLIIDKTNNGGQFFEDELTRLLANKGVKITGFDFRQWTKPALFDALVYGVENHAFTIRTDLLAPEFFSDDEKNKAQSIRWQMKNFECEVEDDGSYNYHGPGGSYDDGVTSCALGWYIAQGMTEEVDNRNVIEEMLSSQFG